MNRKILFFLIAVFTSLQAFAQTDLIEIKNDEQKLKERNLKGISATVYGDADYVWRQWKDFVKSKWEEKGKLKKNVFHVEKTTIEQITNHQGDLFTSFTPQDGEHPQGKLFVSFAVGHEICLTEEKFPEDYAKMKKLFREFVNDNWTDALTKTKEQQEDRLKGIERKIKQHDKKILALKKEVRKSKKAIKKTDDSREEFDYQNQIKVAEEAIETNKAQRDRLEERLKHDEQILLEVEDKLKAIQAR
ncbi:hypothetical protein [Sediminitomix flava]|uniref:Uncharacterized protein n=1 Tax=Sediminitomix flava TaxID=379075 RepID=A0A315ZJQ1_SEDFL|nr:hypothetical protein [Sediminitomix flava]PWJ44914.1 hypothetical protein BC781_1011303 [Sediminitomix flava]